MDQHSPWELIGTTEEQSDWLRRLALQLVRGADDANDLAHDTLLQSYVLESHMRHDLESLASRHLGAKTIGYDEVTGTGAQRIPFEQVDVARAAAYAAEGADLGLQIHEALLPRIQAEAGLARVYGSIEMPVREVLFRMEREGVLIEARQLEAMSHELGQKMLELEAKAHKEAGQPFNLDRKSGG